MKKIVCLFLGVFLALSSLCVSMPTQAKTVTGSTDPYAHVVGNKIYYTLPYIGLFSLDVKTFERKKICSSYMNDIDMVGGFYNPTVKGDYIYADWSIAGDESGLSYICRISKSGKIKKLDKGYNPMIVGKKIYYRSIKHANNQTFFEKNAVGFDYSFAGWKSMNLSGSGKKKVSGKVVTKKRKNNGYKIYAELISNPNDYVINADGIESNHRLYAKKGTKKYLLDTFYLE